MYSMGMLAQCPSKRFGEKMVLMYTPIWIVCMVVIVKTRWYESFGPNDYIGVGIALVVPILFLPLLLASKKEKALPFRKRYIIKAHMYIAILSYIGNHFYTHYFYNVLGMRYTGPLAVGIQINSVPVSMFLMTHVYFLSYHVLISPLLRATINALEWNRMAQIIGTAVVVVLIAVTTAAAETWTISSFPYYTYPDFHAMMTVGSVFYSLFFIVTFPMFFRLDEDPHTPWSLERVAVNALAAMMLVLLFADWWRLFVGGVHSDTPQSII